MKATDFVVKTTKEYVEQMPKAQRKKMGQFFTSAGTARFMAELFEIPSEIDSISILDPGAGSGILAAAAVDRLEEIESIRTIYIVCYENNPDVAELLKSNLEWMKKHSEKEISYELRQENYILSQSENYNSTFSAELNPQKYDIVISNPPYIKLPKTAPEAMSMQDVCYGAPNLYFLFARMSAFNLKENGEMVYIVPRSWTSGAYFKKFRNKFFEEMALEHIHLFESRDKVFEIESVLQETMIFKAKKTQRKPSQILMTTTKNNSDFEGRTVFQAPYETVVSGTEDYVYLVTNEKEANVLQKMNGWKKTLPQIGLKMKTGLTVDFRNKEALCDSAQNGAVPLFYAQHIQNGNVVFPIGKENEYLVTNQMGLLQKNTNYLFVKRFTAKEEHRRLQCGVYLARKNPKYNKISTQNKINFIEGIRELSECTVYGLYVLFNSTFYDMYYRMLNGSTQVNSTEVNSMPVPSLDTIEAMGRKLLKVHDMSETECDKILESYL